MDTLDTMPTLRPLLLGHFGHGLDRLEGRVHADVVDVGLHPGGQGRGRCRRAGDEPVVGVGGGDALGGHGVNGEFGARIGGAGPPAAAVPCRRL